MTDTVQNPTWRINREISLGDVLAVVTAMVLGVMAYTSLDGRVKMVEVLTANNTNQISSTITEIKTELRRLNDRLERITDQHVVTATNGRAK